MCIRQLDLPLSDVIENTLPLRDKIKNSFEWKPTEEDSEHLIDFDVKAPPQSVGFLNATYSERLNTKETEYWWGNEIFYMYLKIIKMRIYI